jgi:hypothetical protein
LTHIRPSDCGLRPCLTSGAFSSRRRAVFAGRTQSAGSRSPARSAAFRIFADSAGRYQIPRPAKRRNPRHCWLNPEFRIVNFRREAPQETSPPPSRGRGGGEGDAASENQTNEPDSGLSYGRSFFDDAFLRPCRPSPLPNPPPRGGGRILAALCAGDGRSGFANLWPPRHRGPRAGLTTPGETQNLVVSPRPGIRNRQFPAASLPQTRSVLCLRGQKTEDRRQSGFAVQSLCVQ